MSANEASKCGCPPCPGRGHDGHGMTHCAECCFGSGVEADEDCPRHGRNADRNARFELEDMLTEANTDRGERSAALCDDRTEWVKVGGIEYEADRVPDRCELMDVEL